MTLERRIPARLLLCSPHFRGGSCPHVANIALPVAERDPPDDDDLEFEFFDEPKTVEAPTRVQPPRRGPGGPPPGEPPPVRPRAPGAGTPILRLAALIGGAIIIAVALVFGITSCRGGKSESAYKEYFQSVSAVTRESDAIGNRLSTLLAEPGLSLDELESGLDGLAQQQAQVVTRASNLSPPSTLTEQQRSLVDAMQLRENGLVRMKQEAAQIQPAADSSTAGVALANAAARLVAGDVVYDDLFKTSSEAVLKQEGITGVVVPASSFVPNAGDLSGDTLSQLISRIKGGSSTTSGGKHGNGIEAVKVLPSGDELDPDTDNQIQVGTDMRIQVLVKNSGDFQETQVQVSLAIQQNPVIKKTQTIPSINIGDTKPVTFGPFIDIQYTEPVTLKVTVKPVKGETNTANNSLEYPVIFSLP
jgi:hypothetical protein